MRRKRLAGGPRIPAWIRHECDGGFDPAAWAEPDDFGLPSRVAESAARGRWIEARNAWLADHDDVAEILIQRLRDLAAAVP